MTRHRLWTSLCLALALAPLTAAAERQQIGRAPEDPDATVAVDGLDWSHRDGRVSIALETQDGRRVEVGTFPEGIVFPSLVFAADGRPYVVSLETAKPLHDRKVLLHPVLQDTALGCRLLQIDRLANTLREGDADLAAQVDAAEAGLRSQHAAYELAWATRVMAALDAMQNDTFGASALLGAHAWPSVRQTLGYAQHVAGAGPDHVAPHWDRLTGAQGRRLDLPRAKPAFFHSDVTALAEGCLAGAAGPSAFQGCLQQRAGDTLFEMLDDRDMLWGAAPPGWEISFGIGETAYDLTPDLSAIAADGGRRTTFVAWVDFRTLPNFVTGGREPWFSANNTVIMNHRDRVPYTLEALEAPLVRSAEALFASTPYWEASREALEAFTLLQRFFRLAFEERFGPNFPIETLTALGEETARTAFGANERTPRWLASPGGLEEEAYFVSRDLSAMAETGRYASLGEGAAACMALLLEKGPVAASRLPHETWGRTCDPEPSLARFAELRGRPSQLDDSAYAVQRSVLQLVKLSYARRIRAELDVARDDGFDLVGEVCPIP